MQIWLIWFKILKHRSVTLKEWSGIFSNKFVIQLRFLYFFWFIIEVPSAIIDPIVPQFGDVQNIPDPQIPGNDTQRPQPVIEEESVSKSLLAFVSSSNIFILTPGGNGNSPVV